MNSAPSLPQERDRLSASGARPAANSAPNSER